MPELPARPDVDQLRRQARELLRAAANGEPGALGRLGAVSGRVTLSAAQLAIAREYGYRSWPALRAEVARRRSPEPAASPPGAPGQRWSFGGATAIETTAGVLFPEVLAAGADHATLHASLTPSAERQPAPARPRRLPVPGLPFARWGRRRHAKATAAAFRALAQFDDLTVVDDRGARYALRQEGMSGIYGPPGEPADPVSVHFGLDPVPGREVGWVELRGRGGAAARLLPSARPAVRLGPLTPAAMSAAERELTDHALALIGLQLSGDPELLGDTLSQQCSAALAKTAQIQRSGGLDPASPLPGQLRQLCAVLTGQRPAGRLPASWAGMLDAARRADGPRHHLDIAADLPPIDGVSIQVDSLISGSARWRLYLRATPGWWHHSQDGHHMHNPVSVHAEDDRGGTYVSTFDGSTGPWPRGYEELALRFRPRLDPLAQALTLTFGGAREQIAVRLRPESATSTQPQ
jgi:hypothetical protein